jgi:TonB family protein
MTPQTDLAQRLIRRAARGAPPALAERLEEEWLADLACRAGALSRLRLAIGCCWATGAITRDFAVPQVATSNAGAGVHTPPGGLQYDFPRLSRRTVTFVTIAAVHVLLIYGFTSGLAQHVLPSLQIASRAVFIQEEQPPRETPPPIPLAGNSLTGKTDPEIPLPPQFDFTPPAPTGPQITTGPELTREAPPETPPANHRVSGGPGMGFPNTADFYPAAARRLAETGATTVQVCVDTQGRLTGDPVVTQGSGIHRLDDGALNLARAGSGHYRPTTENGQPVSACYPYRIRFRLDD